MNPQYEMKKDNQIIFSPNIDWFKKIFHKYLENLQTKRSFTNWSAEI